MGKYAKVKRFTIKLSHFSGIVKVNPLVLAPSKMKKEIVHDLFNFLKIYQLLFVFRDDFEEIMNCIIKLLTNDLCIFSSLGPTITLVYNFYFFLESDCHY